ncbi:type IV pilus twitching motility protein PilT [Microvirga puerhi]|uniref:Flp pilus assembly complex ATPase component TadA n=1 Tax=Microvirga puerhi TaxID=2876078 RepID=A0ABS7VTL7_9HYPH|nr:ATPase, T2SS/T4P/T4SS family [Microvirga puerhi]MBZ6078917.1 Flp pilus assembly complex ATPase component TadA [Microvirga puerhi]
MLQFTNWKGQDRYIGKEAFRLDQKEDLQELLIFAVHQRASDVIFQTGRPVFAEIHGHLFALTRFQLQNNDLHRIFLWMTGQPNAVGRLDSGEEIDAAFSINDRSQTDDFGEPVSLRFRLNITAMQYQGAGDGYQAVLRSIPSTAPTFDEIGFPADLIPYIAPSQGAVLIAGPTGSGKTTTFAACIRHVLEGHTTIRGNILTYESPIEYSYDNIVSPVATIAQHQIGQHIPSFAAGVRNSLRRKPGLIVIGEMRDSETIEAAMEAANTGHPVYSTVHANSVSLIFKRMMLKFSADQQFQAFHDILDTTKVLMSQTLQPKIGGGRCCLREWLIITDEIARQIELAGPERHVRLIREVMDSDARQMPMNRAVASAVKAGLIDDPTAEFVLRRYGYLT